MSYPNYRLNDIIQQLENRKAAATEFDDISFYNEALSCLNDVVSDLQDNQDEIDTLESDIDDKDAEIDALEDSVADLQEEVEQLQQEISDLEDEV